eukprot:1181278-Prorocentrum_minimum.AAC.6
MFVTVGWTALSARPIPLPALGWIRRFARTADRSARLRKFSEEFFPSLRGSHSCPGTPVVAPRRTR